MANVFDQGRADSQATVIEPVAPDAFDFGAYAAYEADLLPRCSAFWGSESGVLVYRRMRVAEVFSYGCRDMKDSLAMQLGGLQKSMDYPADVPNFLEPWYGLGTVASSFGIDYTWHDGQSPAFKPKFNSIQDALDFPIVPVKNTPIGQYTLDTIDYFLEQTQGRIPMSLCDVQSPFNVAAEVVDMTAFLMTLYDCPDKVVELLDRIIMLLSEFSHEQIKRISDALVWPGHGFASSRVFEGFGMADDNSIMLSESQFQKFAASSLVKAARDFAGPVFHSCGNWSHLAPVVKQIPGLRMVDGAFGAQTDPSPNDAEVFGEVFADSGIIVNARIVGDSSEVARQIRKLWAPDMKLIVTTYCQSPEDQQHAYEIVHEICQ
jgi:hypothetical protein